MNNRVLVVVIILGALITGSIVALALSLPSAPAATSASTPVVTETPDPTPTPTPTETVAPGRYLAYTASAFPAPAGRTFLFFYAPWCGQCVDIDTGILAQGVPDGITILKADFDTEQGLEQRYGVTMRTTFVEVDADGNELQRFVAYDTPTFDAVIAAML